MVNFGDLSTEAGLKALNNHLGDNSYVEGVQASQADTTTFDAIKSTPSSDLCHAHRWYKHIQSFGDGRKKFPGTPSDAGASGNGKAAADDDDDVDLFGSDEEDTDSAKVREQRLAEYAAKKTKKPGPIAKSSIVLEVKPWDDETDMKEMESKVRLVETDGLVWGASKLVPVGYGIMKLQIMCTVEDEKVSVDWLTEEIQNFEDHVQSVDIAAFNKV